MRAGVSGLLHSCSQPGQARGLQSGLWPDGAPPQATSHGTAPAGAVHGLPSQFLADFLGAVRSGTGILLAVIIYQYLKRSL